MTRDLNSLTDLLMERALSNKHSEFQYIHSLAELAVAKEFEHATKVILKGFKQAVKTAKSQYFSSLKKADNKVSLDYLTVLGRLTTCFEFYTEEYRQISRSINEYHNYLQAGHRLSAWFGKERSDKDLIDYSFIIR